MDRAKDLARRNADDDACVQTLRRLLALYCESAHEQTARLTRLAARADEHAAALVDCWKIMHASAHRITGAAQSLGLADFALLAGRVEDKLDAMVSGDIGAATLGDDIAALSQACSRINPDDAAPFMKGKLPALAAPPRRAYHGDPALREATILIADDDVIARELVRAILLEEGARDAIAVRNGQEALQHAGMAQPSLIIADWRMSPVSGRELLNQVRSGQSPMLTNTPFIMLTRVHAVGGKRTILQEGANYFIEKPFTRERLMIAVRAALGFCANDAAPTTPAPSPYRYGVSAA